ncbi:MAG: hypothetical protein M1825_003024 [Sarcosagium campestre]|nr:MAG: hypothetical protein M1825_003024 [Sarcosagium campestre]
MSAPEVSPPRIYLFGGDQPWNAHDWTASDDRVRGGRSQSYLDCSPTSPVAEFHGVLDIETLGGAGFASQRTVGQDRTWDLSRYDGLQIDIKAADTQLYTLILKDELLPTNPENGREQSSISHEYDFRVTPPEQNSDPDQNATGGIIFAPWSHFKATYRGREKPDAPPLKVQSIRQISLMKRR